MKAEKRYCGTIQAVREMHGKILTRSYWLHVELGKKIFKKFYGKK
jgi:hypothetical protein